MSEDQYRAWAGELIDLACTVAPLNSRIFGLVTEGRYTNRERVRAKQRLAGQPLSLPYSSCADLGHWLLKRFCNVPYINRDEHNRWNEHNRWKDQINISLLCAWPMGSNRIAKRPTTEARFDTGDILVIGATGDNAHLKVVRSYDPKTRTLVSGDYGQPHGRLSDPIVLRATLKGPFGPELWSGGRRVDSWLNLADVLLHAEKQGWLTEPETAEMYIERHGL